MKLWIYLVFLFGITNLSTAQNKEVKWAYRVLECNFPGGEGPFSASQILGKPNAYPQGGNNLAAFNISELVATEIKVGFREAVFASFVSIVETQNPGFTTKVWVYDADGSEHLVYEEKPKALNVPSRLLHISLGDMRFPVLAVKIRAEGNRIKGINSIDAVALSTKSTPPDIQIHSAEILKQAFFPERLGPEVNSEYKEFGPLISPDGKKLYFSRRYHPANVGGIEDKEDIWLSIRDGINNTWSKAANKGMPLNNRFPNFVSSITPDGNSILLGNTYISDEYMEDGVSMSRMTDYGWSKPQKLIIEDDCNCNERANYFLSNSGTALLMSVEREKDTYGDRDLYVSFIQSDSTWSKPINLGNTINTASVEAAPFLAADHKTLYFSSGGHPGFGGTDIYVSRRLDNSWTSWTEPENLGPRINSSADESFFSMDAFGTFAYFTGPGTQAEDLDIYRTKLPAFVQPLPVVLVSGQVLDQKTNKPVPNAKISYEYLPSGDQSGVAYASPNTGFYSIVLPYGENYGYLAEAEGYISVHANLDLRHPGDPYTLNKDLYLVPISKGEMFTLNNVFFDFDKASLREESVLELNRLLAILIKYPVIQLSVAGHTDDLGSESYNDQLSRNRAETVANYLISKGIEKARLKVEFYGENMPSVVGKTPEARQRNRRVEVTIK